VSLKEMEKALHEATDPEALKKLHKMKARIEVVGDFEDLKKVAEVLKQLGENSSSHQGRP
jgi:hypothetical protein